MLVSGVSVAIVASQHRGAAAALGGCLILAALVPALLTARATRIAQDEGVQAQAAVATAALAALDGATEHRVWGTVRDAAAELDRANRRAERARTAAARPAALATGGLVLVAGGARVASIAIAVAAVAAGHLTGPAAAVVALAPLAAFEAVGALPAATAQAYRSRAAARRVAALIDSTHEADAGEPNLDGTRAAAHPWPLTLDRVRAGWPGAVPTQPVSARLEQGGVLGVVGRSGAGKTTLLLTIAGALPPRSGSVRLGTTPVAASDTGGTVAMTAEDSHVFGTTILENLRVARGDVTPVEARDALATVGLGPWLDRQPHGLDTILGAGGLSVSGGERRRLLLARVLLHPAPFHLIDEPAEHLDEAGGDVVRAVISAARARGTTIVIVTHDRTLLDVVDTVVDLG